jgi:hypothetical protein
MSYKNTVLNDFPNSFYLLDEVESGLLEDYTELLSQFATYQDLKDSGLVYSQLGGISVYDYSGDLNNGSASSSSLKQLMPLVAGGIRGTEILSSTEITYNPKGIATKYYKDNSFSIESWCALPANNISATIVGDPNIDTGIFYENGNIVFKVGSNKVEHTVSNAQVIHVVGIFQSNMLSLYINGSLVDNKSLTSYKFSNELASFKSGPCTGRLVIDSVAFYRYKLSSTQILNHYNEGIKEVNVSQIVSADGGYLFSMNTESLRPKFTYSYPVSKLWSELESNNLYISDNQAYIYLPETESSTVLSSSFTDSILVPNYLNITTSQINWEDDVKGIVVEVSKDNITWAPCVNGKPLPYFNKNDNNIVDVLLIRVTLSSTDTSRYLPILRSLDIKFYNSKDFYSDNSGYYASSTYDYSLPNNNKRTISYHKNNGLTMYNGHGFTLNGIPSVNSVEVIFTPQYNKNVLVSGASQIYEWNAAGAITKTGISSIYVNGINRTSATNVWDFMSVNNPHHIVINFTSAATSIKFNQNQNDSNSGLGHMYNNVAVYENALSVNSILNHYLLYTDNATYMISDTSLGLSESNIGDSSTPFFITLVEPESVSL